MSISARLFFRYLPTSERDRQWGLHVVGAGRQHVLPGDRYPPEGHPAPHEFAWDKGRVLQEFQIVYITAGEGEFESEKTGRQAVSAGTAILVFPEVWHRYRPSPTVGWDEYWVAFSGEDAARMLERGFLSPDKAVVQVGVSETLLRPFNTLLDRVHGEPIGFQQLIAADAMSIIAGVLAGEWNQQVNSRDIELVRKIKLELEKNSDGTVTIERLAAELDISPSHLHHIFKKHTGLSPYQYHLQMKMFRARQLLRGSDLSIKEIARTLSFENAFHFSKVFKKKNGASPRLWRSVRNEKMEDTLLLMGDRENNTSVRSDSL